MRDFGPRPLPVSPLEGAKVLFSIAIYSVTPTDIATVLSPLGTRLGSLYSAPSLGGLGPQIWGSGSPNRNFTSGEPEIFCEYLLARFLQEL